jgi:hypothetical protein
MSDNSYQVTNTLLYEGSEGAVTIDVIIDQIIETMWTTQKTMAEVFQVNVRTINEHLQNIFKTQELNENSTFQNFWIVQNEGNRKVERNIKFYNLDVIIAVGYRVNSKQGTQFRIWVNKILKEYIVKGFAIDVQLLKEGSKFGIDYFNRLGEIYREIRTSERRVYEKITDIYSTSYDYKVNAQITKEFFANVQNKLHFAVSGLTAPEIIFKRADSSKPNMGLSN